METMVGQAAWPQERQGQISKRRRDASIQVCDPVVAPFACRRCGGLAWTWRIVGIGEDPPKYWECTLCGQSEVVKGTPMLFGEPMLGDPLSPEVLAFLDLCQKSYVEYRKRAGLPSLD